MNKIEFQNEFSSFNTGKIKIVYLYYCFFFYSFTFFFNKK